MSQVIGSFGRLWGRGHETFSHEWRRILSVSGAGATNYLQGLVTCDLLSEPTPPRPEPVDDRQPGIPDEYQRTKEDYEKLPRVEFSSKCRAACFLDNKGRIVTDSILWKVDDQQYYIDVPGNTADDLIQHLKTFVLRRSKVKISYESQMKVHVVFGTLNAAATPKGYVSAMDPRHPSLGMRVLSLPSTETTPDDRHQQFSKMLSNTFPESPGNYELVRRLVGVAEGTELQGKVALETNQELLNAVSFNKGCYLGQELTARVQHTGVLRKRIMPLYFISTNTALPSAWNLAGQLQEERKKNTYTAKELAELPSKLPRLSVLGAGNLVGLFSASAWSNSSDAPTTPETAEQAEEEVKKLEQEFSLLLDELETHATSGTKLVDTKAGQTIGQIIAPPVKGTNVALAMMRLDRVGLLGKHVWDKTNRIKLGEGSQDLRYLPYLPLWWPPINEETGKAQEDDGDDESDLEDLE